MYANTTMFTVARTQSPTDTNANAFMIMPLGYDDVGSLKNSEGLLSEPLGLHVRTLLERPQFRLLHRMHRILRLALLTS